jgi:hypothetical protein
MQKSKFSLASTAAISLMLAISLPGSGQTQGVFEACSDELQNYCSQVTPGNGRLFACFYAHEDKLSEGCDAAIVDECGDDIAKHCQEVELGGGRIYSCLKDSSDKLSDTCAEVIGQIELPAN